MRICKTALTLYAAPLFLVLSHGADQARAADIPREAARSIQEGNRLLDAGHHEEALAMFERAAAKAPKLAEAVFNRGVALYRLGRFEEAETAFQDALRPGRPDLEPRATYNLARTAHASALARGADIEASLKDITRAINFYKDALALKPNDPDAVRNLAMAEGMQAFLKRKLEQIQKEQPPDSDGSPSDSDKNDSEKEQKQSDQGEQGESDSDESKKGDESSKEASSENSDSSNRQSDSQGQEGGEPSDQSEQSDSQPSEDQRDGADADREESERDGLASPEGDGSTDDDSPKPDTESAADATTQPAENDPSAQDANEAETQPQPEDSAAHEEGQDNASSTTTQPAPGFDINDLSREHALRLLEDAREMERKRRETLRRRALMRRGRIEVEKDW